MTATNDSTRYVRLAKENSWAVPPPWTLTESGSAGTLTLTWNGLTTSTIAYNANAAAVTSALEALSGMGTGNCPCTGTLTGGMTLTPAGWRGALAITANFSGITGGTNSITGGPVYTMYKAKMVQNETAINMELAEEIRNAPDMLYEDSVANGGAWEDWTIDAKARPDQTPLLIAGTGYADTTTTVGGESAVYDHAQTPANPGATYSVQVYDGQAAWVAIGLVGTDLELKGTGGENGQYDVMFKGWSQKVQNISPPTVTLPGNTSYKMLKPTNSGVAAQLNSVASSLVLDWTMKWTRDAKPKFTQIGSVNPYRVEYGKRKASFNIDMLFDDITELTAALLVPQVSRSFQIVIPGVESIGVVPSKPQLTINLYRLIYKDKPKIDKSGASPKLSLAAEALYDTSNAAQVKLTTRNQTAASY